MLRNRIKRRSASLTCKREQEILPASEIKIPGVHNIENYMAAFCCVDGLVPKAVMVELARTFGGVAHRIQLIREKDGVRYYDSSIDSSPNRTRAALRSFPDKVIMIAGGKDKGIGYDDLGHGSPFKQSRDCSRLLWRSAA